VKSFWRRCANAIGVNALIPTMNAAPNINARSTAPKINSALTSESLTLSTLARLSPATNQPDLDLTALRRNVE
jgi:hypothetical protein